MGKKSFGGTKLNVKDVLTPEPKTAAQAPPAKAWTAGTGKAAQAAPKSVAPAPAVPKGPALAGKWAKSAPQGLAATSTSVQSAAQPSSGFAPAPRAAGAPKKLALGAKQDPGAKLKDDDFVELSRPQTAAEKKAEAVAEAKAAARAEAFPATSTPEQALDALCSSAAVASDGCSDEVRIAAGLGWLLQSGLSEAVAAKRHENVLSAGQSVVRAYAPKGHARPIQEQLDNYFAEQQKKAKPSASELEANGLVDASLYGELALHLAAGDAKIHAIHMRLLRRLTKPSTTHLVHVALADALASLVAKWDTAEDTIKFLFENMGAAQESVRRGVGLGIGGVLKGAGNGALKQLGIMQTIKDALNEEGKSAAGRRQGALICLENVASVLDHSFEPYAVPMIPLLLQCCSDPARDVQIASRDAAKSIVSKMRPVGVRMLVNPILQGLSDKGWRTRVSAIDLLTAITSSMIADGPKRLASLLPKVIPPLCEAAAESRSEIRNAARQVFEQIGNAVTHVDLKASVPSLVKALTNPSDSTTATAMDDLLKAVFTTFLDAPSLALMSPVIARGIVVNSPAVRKNAAGMVRTLTSIVPEDLAPFLLALWQPLTTTIVDQSPEVREAAASAIGAVAAVLPEEELQWASFFQGILSGSGDPSELDGAARGLSCVLAGLDDDRRQEHLDELLGSQANASHGGLAARARVLAYLPQALGPSVFSEIMPRILPVLHTGLGDAADSVRDACEQALSAACDAVGKANPDPLVEMLEKASHGLMPQARTAVITLAGKLLKKLGANDNCDYRDRLLVVIFIAQSDGNRDVRTAADRTFRQSVDGPPGKTLRSLKQLLFRQLQDDFCDSDESIAACAGRCAVEVHRKLSSDAVFDDVRPLLVLAFDRAEAHARKSACVALKEMLRMKEGQEVMNSQLAASLQELLGDPEEAVRAAAGKCVASAQSIDIAGSLLDTLCDEDEPTEEDVLALQELLRSKANTVLPDLLERVAKPPVSAGKVACLSVLASVPATFLQQHVCQMFRALRSIVLGADSDLQDKAVAAAEEVTAQLDQSASSEAASEILPGLTVGGVGAPMEASARILGAILAGTQTPLSDCSSIMAALLPPSIQGNGVCIAALANAHKAFAPATLVDEIHRIHSSLKECSGEVSAALLGALQPILQNGLATGDAHQKLDAAASYTIIITHADEGVLPGVAVKLAGPLVRALTASIEPDLAVSLVQAIGALLTQEGSSLKPLAPAIQTSLLRYLDDKWPETVQVVSAQALGGLAALILKPETLIKSLCKPPQKTGHLKALDAVMSKLPQPASAEILALVQEYRSS
eukprot:TRINITY_DN103004_c0_g1_i1.p1 TRINITY_DN103004_c0_g1~~TRINITY_DN103004_c0_g1_i1.p1  ORF type:complete len:1318 (-),score=271.95 TRINITY_DN103004_c0_g1_i1:27-3980(-)